MDILQTLKQQKLLTFLFCGFLALMGIAYLILPRQDFSQQEKRYLAQAPAVTRERIASGDFSADVDTFLADHIPGRNFFVGLNACWDLLTGRQNSKDILVTSDLRLVEAPVKPDPDAVEKNMSVINSFAQSQRIPVDLMVVPSAGWACESRIPGVHPPYEDEALIRSIYDLAGENIRCVDILSVFSATGAPEEFYYRTDHHWNSAGAYTACRTYMELLGKTPLLPEDYRIETVSGFRGSAHSRSALWMIPEESLELWTGGENIQVTHENLSEAHTGIFFRERLEESDKYTVYLDGNHSLVQLHNPDAAGQGKLLVIRDSFSNCLGGFLGDSFETVVLADLRYYRQPLSQLIEEAGFDRILICYSLGNFMTDTNMIWLR